tara:strand:- start:192 stop:752 length:561 start_codon:yes stop_codon:yes gene_type:complete
MAKRAYEKGWEKAPWAKPIAIALEEEKIDARSLRAKQRTDDFLAKEAMRAAAKNDAVEARAQEGQMVKMARGASLALLGQVLQSLRTVQPLAEELKRAVAEDAKVLDAKDIFSLLDKVAKLTTQATQTAQSAMRMERLHMGEPEAVLGLELGTLSTDDIHAELAAIETTLRVVPPPADLAIEVGGT